MFCVHVYGFGKIFISSIDTDNLKKVSGAIRKTTSLKHVKPSSNFLTNTSKRALLLCIILLFVFCVGLCHAVLSVYCSLVVTCWERADLLALLYVMFSCVFSLSHMVS